MRSRPKTKRQHPKAGRSDHETAWSAARFLCVAGLDDFNELFAKIWPGLSMATAAMAKKAIADCRLPAIPKRKPSAMLSMPRRE